MTQTKTPLEAASLTCTYIRFLRGIPKDALAAQRNRAAQYDVNAIESAFGQLLDLDEFDIEDEGRIRWDARQLLRSIGELRRAG